MPETKMAHDANWWCRECGWFPAPDADPMPQTWVPHPCVEARSGRDPDLVRLVAALSYGAPFMILDGPTALERMVPKIVSAARALLAEIDKPET